MPRLRSTRELPTVKKSPILWSILCTMTLVLLLLQVIFCPLGASSSEYWYLNGIGGSMYPTIGELDRVEVKTKVDPASVQVGDIIVYGSIAAAAYVPYPQAMWICHRVVEKYEESGTLCFRTKGDNNSYIDPWKVPAIWLLGVVTNIEHVSAPTPAPPANEEQSGNTTPEEAPNMFLIGSVAATFLIVAGALVSVRSRVSRRLENQRIFRKGLCYSCRHYETEYQYSPIHADGRFGIRRTASSRGFCKYHNLAVFEGTPESRCNHDK